MKTKQEELDFDLNDLIDWRELEGLINSFEYKDFIKKNILKFRKNQVLEHTRYGISKKMQFGYDDGPSYVPVKDINAFKNEVIARCGDQIIDIDDISYSIVKSENYWDDYEYYIIFYFNIKSTPENAKEVIQDIINKTKKEHMENKNKAIDTVRMFPKEYIEELREKYEERK